MPAATLVCMSGRMSVRAKALLVASGLVGALVVAILMVAIVIPRMPVACPAIGWINTLEIRLAGDIARLETLIACTDDGCATPEQNVGPTGLQRIDDARWQLTLTHPAPELVTINAVDASGQLIGHSTATPDWVRVGGSEACGGPMEADAVTVTLR